MIESNQEESHHLKEGSKKNDIQQRRPRVFFDATIGGKAVGKMVSELYDAEYRLKD